MSEPGFVVRRMARADLDTAFGFCEEENWNPGRYDPDAFFAADPNGFFIGELDGVPIGSVSAVAYDDTFGFIGIFILRPPYRGKGYGLTLFRAAMEYLGNRNIGLDGVIAQQENYKLSGFKLAYRTIRYQGVGGGEAPDGVSPLSEVSIDALNAYDRNHFPAARPAFLAKWITQPESAAFGVLENGNLRGYGVIRARLSGFQIGPIFADTPAIADTLFRALTAQKPGATIYFDAIEPNPEGVALAERHGLTPIFETARMYTQEPPPLPLREIYSITSFELG